MRSSSVPVDPASRRRQRVENLQRQLDSETGQLEDAKRDLDEARGTPRERELRGVVAQLRRQADVTRRSLSKARVRAGRGAA